MTIRIIKQNADGMEVIVASVHAFRCARKRIIQIRSVPVETINLTAKTPLRRVICATLNTQPVKFKVNVWLVQELIQIIILSGCLKFAMCFHGRWEMPQLLASSVAQIHIIRWYMIIHLDCIFLGVGSVGINARRCLVAMIPW